MTVIESGVWMSFVINLEEEIVTGSSSFEVEIVSVWAKTMTEFKVKKNVNNLYILLIFINKDTGFNLLVFVK